MICILHNNEDIYVLFLAKTSSITPDISNKILNALLTCQCIITNANIGYTTWEKPIFI